MDRRSFLGLTVAVPPVFAGCLGFPSEASQPAPAETASTTPTETPTATTTPTTTERTPPDCEDPSRPEPEEGSESVEPATYPSRPESLADRDAAAEYVQAYEAAYRRNALLEEHGDSLDSVQTGVGEPRVLESTPASAVARVTYTYGYRMGATAADSAPIHVSYYVDDSIVLRAEEVGPLEDESELEPDPLTEGTVLECFE